MLGAAVVTGLPILDALPTPSCALAAADMAGTGTCSCSGPAPALAGTEEMQFAVPELRGRLGHPEPPVLGQAPHPRPAQEIPARGAGRREARPCYSYPAPRVPPGCLRDTGWAQGSAQRCSARGVRSCVSAQPHPQSAPSALGLLPAQPRSPPPHRPRSSLPGQPVIHAHSSLESPRSGSGTHVRGDTAASTCPGGTVTFLRPRHRRFHPAEPCQPRAPCRGNAARKGLTHAGVHENKTPQINCIRTVSSSERALFPTPVLLGVFHLQGLTLLPWSCSGARAVPAKALPKLVLGWGNGAVAVLEPWCPGAVSSPQTQGFGHKPEPQPGLVFWRPPATLSTNLDAVRDSLG